MAMISFEDEKNLQRKICNKLNKFGYHFEKEIDSYFCDIVDKMIKAYCEVKTNGEFAPHQLLYGIAKENIQDAQFLILANEYEMRIFIPPKFDDILAFSKRISKNLSVSPSSITSKRFLEEAFNILGDHLQIYNYSGDFKIDEKQPFIFLDDTNYEYFQFILTKYRIHPAEFINKFANTWTKKSKLLIKNDHQTILDIESGKEVKAQRNIVNKFDIALIQSTRIRAFDIEKIIHRIDELSSLDIRRKRGKYWSNLDVSEIATELIREYVKPTFIFEPFVGGGSLVRDLVGECNGVVNDIDGSSVDLLEQEWEGYDWQFNRNNILTTHINDLIKWIPEFTEKETFCIYTNPPFGTSSTNALVSTEKEIQNMAKKSTSSRKNNIQYGSDKIEAKYIGDMYGHGDLCIPCIGKMIEIIKNKWCGYLTFFSPFGVMLGRSRYNKLLKALLKDFEFVHGEVFDGSMFNGVSKNKPISFTIWKYKKNCQTNSNSLTFCYKEKEYHTKILSLLKNGWKYNMCDDGNEIGTTRNDTFNNPNPKMLKTILHNAGSQMIQENVIISLQNEFINDPLIYGLWSVIVGNRSITNYPIIFDNCYTHLPDFTKTETFEILAYTILSILITELKNNNCEGKIGFVGMSRIFKFGGKELTKGATYLIETYKHCPIGELTIGMVFERLKNNEDSDEIDKKLRILIKKEIEERLNIIGYWDYLPIPQI
ncbi:MAG: hypothetical protein WC934_06405 [Acidithiobacillus sp.]|jgi:hypothetical protein|uniref:hypothetical protein n=1 Tax=Acidithiobacillus sp. TaxID=1872118 RepID=UPI0035600405